MEVFRKGQIRSSGETKIYIFIFKQKKEHDRQFQITICQLEA